MPNKTIEMYLADELTATIIEPASDITPIVKDGYGIEFILDFGNSVVDEPCTLTCMRLYFKDRITNFKLYQEVTDRTIRYRHIRPDGHMEIIFQRLEKYPAFKKNQLWIAVICSGELLPVLASPGNK